MASSKTIEQISHTQETFFFVKDLQKNYQNSLIGNDPKYFLLFAYDIKAVLDRLVLDGIVDYETLSYEAFSRLYSEIDQILLLYKNTAFAFRYHATYVISTEDFETIQITSDDVKRWYHFINKLLLSLMKDGGDAE